MTRGTEHGHGRARIEPAPAALIGRGDTTAPGRGARGIEYGGRRGGGGVDLGSL
ncbi:hypothetical protein [Streptomyces sp. NPDC052107]|uniref:hypothetical protein n=1 Tax=Streptomyces sp. NPDC052107 TaxID=3155632 RepID=UPI0034496533